MPLAVQIRLRGNKFGNCIFAECSDHDTQNADIGGEQKSAQSRYADQCALRTINGGHTSCMVINDVTRRNEKLMENVHKNAPARSPSINGGGADLSVGLSKNLGKFKVACRQDWGTPGIAVNWTPSSMGRSLRTMKIDRPWGMLRARRDTSRNLLTQHGFPRLAGKYRCCIYAMQTGNFVQKAAF